MIKKALIGLYIVIILAIAGFARAASDIHVTQVQKVSDRLIAVSGSYNATCDINLVPQLSEINPGFVRNVASIKLIPQKEMDHCLQVEREYQFDLVIDTYLLEIVGEYDIAIIGSDESIFQPTVSISESHFSDNHSQSIIRGVLTSQDGLYVVTNNDRSYELNINSVITNSLENYIGQQVYISGYIFDSNANTILKPFSGIENDPGLATLVVSSIHSAIE